MSDYNNQIMLPYFITLVGLLYIIMGTADTKSSHIDMTVQLSNPDAATYAISGMIDRVTGDIALFAKSNKVGYTSYTVSGSFDPQSGKLQYVRAKPGSFHRPKFYLTGSIDWARGHIKIMAESQRSIYPNYTISSQSKTKAVLDT